MAVSLLSAWERLAALPVQIDAVGLERLQREVSSGFTRVTTVVRISGGGHDGVGEDVTYTAPDHDGFPPPEFPARASLGELCDVVGSLDLFARPPEMEASRNYRRWAVESAVLDLALSQHGLSLAKALAREARPVEFVVSTRLGDPASAKPLRRLMELYPGLRFKLDPTADWDDVLVAELAATGAVAAIDLKGAYHGTAVDLAPDPELYLRVAEGFPEAWIEDPALTPQTDAALEPYRGRITWDAPIHSVADVEALPFPPRCLNVKPSRFGSLAELLRFYDYCAERNIALYGGGQFELGPGRGQIQYLASLLHADAPNDIAPGGFNEPEPPAGLPASPLVPAAAPTGFRWG
jgi:L-alanine-DL-glutamate epimerase-like enolase superfamily enzyme